ncbi:Integrin alpha-8, partial [Eufriesea mexicana]
MWYANFFAGLIGLIFIVGSPPWCSDAFNVDTKHYAVYRRDPSSMFGFAVSVYRARDGRGYVIVGAPEAETAQKDVYRGGAVYECDITVDDRCTLMEFDNTGHNHIRNPSVPGALSQIDNKTLQWFGATVSASFEDGGPIMLVGSHSPANCIIPLLARSPISSYGHACQTEACIHAATLIPVPRCLRSCPMHQSELLAPRKPASCSAPRYAIVDVSKHSAGLRMNLTYPPPVVKGDRT